MPNLHVPRRHRRMRIPVTFGAWSYHDLKALKDTVETRTADSFSNSVIVRLAVSELRSYLQDVAEENRAEADAETERLARKAYAIAGRPADITPASDTEEG